jgi:hypothetical protein
VLLPGREGVDVDRIAHDEASIRRLVDRFAEHRSAQPVEPVTVLADPDGTVRSSA